uniref:Uncharacterized protein n=1 Tax=Panagrolaimus superbus TaxID=310955 RepID=A0A914YN76_9BILA
MSDSSKVVIAFKNAFGIDVNYEGENVYTVDCKHEALQTYLGTRTVLDALMNNGYSAVRCDHGYAISHENKEVGKIYAKDKIPKKEGEEEKKQ